ncbi:unnamed protein product [Rhizophagus irregularis]|nr:unnamed protein product [Rhizophagus irregularis]
MSECSHLLAALRRLSSDFASNHSTSDNSIKQKHHISTLDNDIRGEPKKDEDEVEEDTEAPNPPNPCKNHSPSVRCFCCFVGSKEKKVKRVGGNIFN